MDSIAAEFAQFQRMRATQSLISESELCLMALVKSRMADQPHGGWLWQGPPGTSWADSPDSAQAVKDDFDAAWAPVLARNGFRMTSTSTLRLYGSPDARDARVVYSATVVDSRGYEVATMTRVVNVPLGRVSHEEFVVMQDHQNRGIATEVNNAMFRTYKVRGMSVVTVHANMDVGGYTWAKQGFEWDMGEYAVHQTPRVVKAIIDAMLGKAEMVLAYESGTGTRMPSLSDPSRADEVYREIVEMRQRADAGDYPSPIEIAMIGYSSDDDETWPGKEAMLRSNWHGKRVL